MRRVLRHIILVALCVLPFVAQAQTDIQLSQYWAAPSYYNAGATGQGDKMNFLVGTRQQWIGIEGAPSSFWGRADMPLRFLGAHHGVGIAFSSTQEGLFSNMVIGAQYAYKLKIKKSFLCFGVQLGLVDQKFDGSKVEIPSSDHHTPPGEDEDIPTTEVSGMAFDAAFGVYYVHPLFHVGLQQSERSSQSHFHRFELFESRVGLWVPLPLPIIPFSNVQRVVVADAAGCFLFFHNYSVCNRFRK
jgi:type IX secretion system PorP/SprF family membrane protein